MAYSAQDAFPWQWLRAACLLLLFSGTARADTPPNTPPEQPVSLAQELLTYPSPSSRPSMRLPKQALARDQGVTASFLSYDFNTNQSRKPDHSGLQRYNLNYTAGFNAGAWRLRHQANAKLQESHKTYDVINSYAQHDLQQFNSRLTLGQYSTPGDLFDGVDFSGMQLRSDEQMRPESQRGYAPVVRGIARTSATVTIRQQGSVIYETTVSPGEFVIDDLIAPEASGDLEVMVNEADGSNHRFSVPYLSEVDLMRPGTSSYSFSLGRLRQQQHIIGPWFGQSTWRQGLNNYASLYTGGILADGYGALVVGSATATPFGAVSADITSSSASNMLSDDGTYSTMQGESYRFGYSHHLDSTDTSFALAAYRFSNEDYVSLEDFAWDEDADDNERERDRFQLTISQPVGDWGQLDLSGTDRRYWGNDSKITTYQLGYQRDFNWGNLYLSAGQNIEDDQPSSLYLASVRVPLGLAGQTPDLTTSASFGDDEQPRLRARIGDDIGPEQRVNYQAHASVVGAEGTQLDDYGASLKWNTPATLFGANFSHEDNGTQQYNASLSGTMLAHSGGLVLSPERGDTMVLITPQSRSGKMATGPDHHYIKASSNALLAGLTPYQANSIKLETTTEDQWHTTTRDIVPTQGAIIVVSAADYPQPTLDLYEQVSADTAAEEGGS
ncbi:fimbria/pilus outer membrane usher protein [Halomonas huangheensis]|uniref:PapC-like C-terminal domain-containing protein n=1 Tax=Halomonas huangheensis TaxID=1178482 RepID=W1N3M9_9GAMM|nr:fimbria/pilus outer membrane usher protein [Halomonas huangheensis]ALM51336.1 hypothetical protein AR456_02765 [Halomonas huangheensis]ERL49766.1 hypothetical protein BJB45_01210 [Halomonas huangheensis]